MGLLMLLVVFWVPLSVMSALIASGKGHSALRYFFLSLFLSPIVGVTAALMAKSYFVDE